MTPIFIIIISGKVGKVAIKENISTSEFQRLKGLNQ